LFANGGHGFDDLIAFVCFAVGMPIGFQARARVGWVERVTDSEPDTSFHNGTDGFWM
jgi:hypothetical protein